jgi:outer membrane protein assembly factor BamB
MPMHPGRPRPGRLLDWIVVAPLLFVFAGLAVYHYRRLDGTQVDPDVVKESAGELLDEPINDTNDWPQWRGPHRNGVSTETGILTEWPSEGPKALWEQKTGDGFASVAVAKGRVFTIFQDGDSESVVAWDAETGKEYWRFSYPCRYKNYYGSGPRSTPSVDGDFIYIVGATGLMHCLKAFSDNPKGELVWQKDLLQEFSAKAPQWGVSFSPLVEGERVFLMPGGPNGNSLAALDKRTGALLWKQHDDLASYTSPVAATLQQERQIVFLTGSRLISVHPDTGEQLWDYPWPIENQTNIATPIVVQSYVFISSNYGKGCVLLKIDKDGEKMKPRFVYKNTHMRTHFSTCVRYHNHLFGFDDSTLKCMNFLTGELEKNWKVRGFDKGSVLRVKDHLILYGANGLLALSEANPKEYVEIARFQFSAKGRACWSAPVVSNGRLYVRDQERLVCFDVKAASR